MEFNSLKPFQKLFVDRKHFGAEYRSYLKVRMNYGANYLFFRGDEP